MKKDNVIQQKSFDFAVRVVNLYKYLVEEKAEYVMSKQLLRCGTSIGANISESNSAESIADFIHKLALAQKETDETIYWIKLLYETNYLSENQYSSISHDCIEIKKILVSIAVSLKSKKQFS